MKRQIVIGLLIITGLLSCNEQDIVKPHSALFLKIEGQEDAVQWETITTKWAYSSGNAELTATGTAFDRCVISLNNIYDTGTFHALSLAQFYYTDGINFMPDNISGTLTIAEIDQSGIKGSFSFSLQSNFNGYSQKNICGEFYIVR